MVELLKVTLQFTVDDYNNVFYVRYTSRIHYSGRVYHKETLKDTVV